MNSKTKTFTQLALAAITMLTFTACGSHNSGNNNQVVATSAWVGTENLTTNTDYQGQLFGVSEKNVRALMHKACGDQCQSFSPDAIIDFVMTTPDSAQVRLTFPSLTGGPAATVALNVTIEANRQGESLRFRSVDLSGRLEEGGVLALSSRGGLIGTAQLGNL